MTNSQDLPAIPGPQPTASEPPTIANTQDACHQQKLDFLIRFGQTHESFRLAEIRALAEIAGVDMEVVSYSPLTPYTHIRLPSLSTAKSLISRSILAQSIHELWGSGATLSSLHSDVRARSSHLFPLYERTSFRFAVDCFQNSRTKEEQVAIINSFAFVGFKGEIRMSDPEETFTVFEEWEEDPTRNLRERGGKSGEEESKNGNSQSLSPSPSSSQLRHLYLGRFLARSSRDQITHFDLKKRAYISTTSMDSELSLVTANLCLASPGKLFYDPFVGTGSFPLAAAHFGALVFGSDIDGRALRGTGGWTGGTVRKEERCLRGNFEQYGLRGKLGDVWVADLVNTPVRSEGEGGKRWLDGILCDPPYGVREGLRVLGSRNPQGGKGPKVDADGVETFKKPDYIPPKRPYSFDLMLHDILSFAFSTLVDGGRLSFWMPAANEGLSSSSSSAPLSSSSTTPPSPSTQIPHHPGLLPVSTCTQPFNKWSRILLTYRRLPSSEIDPLALTNHRAWIEERKRQEDLTHDAEEGRGSLEEKREVSGGKRADDLNPFRKAYFGGFDKKPPPL